MFERDTNRSPRFGPEESVLLTFCLTGTLGIAPFAFSRLLSQDWLVGCIDIVLICLMSVVGVLVWKRKWVRAASIFLTICYMIVVVTVVHLKGPAMVYWFYPAIASTFFFLRQKEAILISLVAILAMAPNIYERLPRLEFATVCVTLTLISLIAFIFASRTRAQHRQLSLLALKDPLTGVGNRRAFTDKLKQILEDRRRELLPVSLLVLDLDNFKEINDTCGHSVGDQVLCRVAEIILQRIRVTDSLYRVGGEEFVVLAAGTRLDDAILLAELLRCLIEHDVSACGPKVTTSIGVAEVGDGKSGDDCFKLADRALYEAKKVGRNRVCVAA